MSTAIPPQPTDQPMPAGVPAKEPFYPQVLITADHPFPEPPTDLIDNDEVPLESDWHRLEMTLLIDSTTQHMGERRDYFVGGNMFIYYSSVQARNRDYRGPDFFFVDQVPLDKPRNYWAIWDEEGRYPDVVIELGSKTTIKEDRTKKKEIYEKTFKLGEYFIYEPETDALEGFTLVDGHYSPKEPNARGWLWCQKLGLWLGRWTGEYQGKRYVYLRWFDQNGNLVLTKAEAERERAEAERQRAEAERERAEAERQRAEAAEAELARLRTMLEQQKPGP